MTKTIKEYNTFNSYCNCSEDCPYLDSCDKSFARNKFGVCERIVKERLISQGKSTCDKINKFIYNSECNCKCIDYDTCTYKDQRLKNLYGFCNCTPNYRIISSKNIIEEIEKFNGNYNDFLKLQSKVNSWKNADEKDVKKLKEIAVNLGINIDSITEYSPSEIAEMISDFNSSIDEFFKLQNKIKSWKNASDKDVKKFIEIAINLGIDIHRQTCFIEPYDQSKKFIESSQFNLEIFDEPIVLNHDNLDQFEGHSIVWELYDIENGESIYVGETRDFKYEREALRMYIDRDKEGTIRRCSNEYGYPEIQPLIKRIFERDFCIRILAVGTAGDSRSVRAYESVWNEECNDGRGCVEKQ